MTIIHTSTEAIAAVSVDHDTVLAELNKKTLANRARMRLNPPPILFSGETHE
ncbi:MAG: hypothetical protein IIB71_08240 [Proteobacteria bacterium]|nr:hypothetical protein [Pseudomonadota bacterium]